MKRREKVFVPSIPCDGCLGQLLIIAGVLQQFVLTLQDLNDLNNWERVDYLLWKAINKKIWF